jgi:hypothetical protein
MSPPIGWLALLPLVSLRKGQRKDDLAKEYLARFTDTEGVPFIGVAHEKARLLVSADVYFGAASARVD